MQTWPAFRYLPAALISAVFSGSTSSNTTTGAWPPSSMVARFMPSAASLARCLPTGTEPVKEILRTASLRIRCSEIVRRHAEHEIEDALGQSRLLEAAHHLDAAARRFLGRLQDQRTTGAERARDLARRRQRRKVPRRECGAHADRLLQHELAHAAHASRNDAAIGAAAFFAHPLDHVGGRVHFHAQLGDDLALLQGHDARDLFLALAHEIGGLAHDARALVGRHRAPHREALDRRVERMIEIGDGGVRQLGQRLFVGGIDHRLELAPAVLHPGAVDIESEFGVHGPSIRGVVVIVGRSIGRARPRVHALRHRRAGGKVRP